MTILRRAFPSRCCLAVLIMSFVPSGAHAYQWSFHEMLVQLSSRMMERRYPWVRQVTGQFVEGSPPPQPLTIHL